MKKMTVRVFNKRSLLSFSVVLFFIGFLISIKLTSISLIIMLICWMLNFKELKFNFLLKKTALHFKYVFFVFLIIGLIHTPDIAQGQKLVIRHLSFILLPTIFLTIKKFKKPEINFIINSYIYSTTFFFVVCLFNAFYRQFVFFNQGGPFNWYFFYRYDFLEIFNQHPTYVSIFTILSLSFLFNYGQQILKKRRVFFFIIILQALSIVLYGSRMGYILLLIIIMIQTFKHIRFKSFKAKLKLGICYLLAIVVFLSISWNIPIVKERIQFTFGYKKDYKFNDKNSIKEGLPEEQGRLLLWKDAFELIKKRPLLGYGTGSSNKILLQKYKENGHLLFLEKKFNVHSTYFEILLIGGVTLLLIYLIILGILLYYGIKRRDLVLITFFLIISMTSITETLFRVQGIVFFSFFFCFFILNNKKDE